MIPVLGVPTLLAGHSLARLVESIDHPVGHLVIIDNGRWWPRWSPLVNLHTPPDVDRVTVVQLPGNLGVAGAWNLIVKSTPFAPWWLIINDDVWFEHGQLPALAKDARPDRLLLSSASPPWACFALGSEVVDRVGLFDERFHPAYFEDNDYARRCRAAGIPETASPVAPSHDNSHTLRHVPNESNDATFAANREWHRRKSESGDGSDGWDLARRRALAWEPN